MKNIGFVLMAVVMMVTSWGCETYAPVFNHYIPPSVEYKNQEPQNVIIMIGDGMGLTQITAGMYANNGLNLERLRHIGLLRTNSAKELVTDSAAGATAYATGQKTYNGAISVDVNKKKLKTLFEYAQERDMSTGLVVTSTVVHATPAAFYSHKPSRQMYHAIASDLATASVDIIMGGGMEYFKDREDGMDLVAMMESQGYTVTTDWQEADNSTGKLAYFCADGDPLTIGSGRGEYLKNGTIHALEELNKDNDGFMLLVEGSQIDWGGHANNSGYIISELIDFDKAIGEVLDFAEKDGNTLVVITADHETGGYAINGGNFDGKLETAFTTGKHTATMVPVFAYGPGSDIFTGIYENTGVFFRIAELMGLDIDEDEE